MSPIDAALAAIESLSPGEQLSYRKLQQSITVTVQRLREGIKAFQPHARSQLKIAIIYTPSRSMSSYNILAGLLSEDYHLYEQ